MPIDAELTECRRYVGTIAAEVTGEGSVDDVDRKDERDAVIEARGVPVRAIVRSAARLPQGAAADPLLTVVEAELASLPADELRRHVAGSDAVISCLGHTISLRGGGERAYMWVLRGLLPPARGNQRAADFLAHEIGADHPFVAWVVVRRDALVDGEVSGYRTHDGIITSLFRSDGTRFANAAHFMPEHATDDAAWRRWRGKMPVIVDDAERTGPSREGGGA